jgi:hypothetical protein
MLCRVFLTFTITHVHVHVSHIDKRFKSPIAIYKAVPTVSLCFFYAHFRRCKKRSKNTLLTAITLSRYSHEQEMQE